MTIPVIVAIDEGTTNAKTVCIDKDGQIVSKGSQRLSISHPKAAWSEQDPWEIIKAVEESIRQALIDRKSFLVKGIAISNQRESVLIWDRSTGQPVTPVVTWQCRRSTEICQRLADSPFAEEITHLTGLPVDPLFPAAKIQWLLSEIPNGTVRAENGELCVGTIDTWLVWNLTGGQSFVTDYSNASRTQLFNIHDLTWDEFLLNIFNIPFACLPNVVSSSGIRGETKNCSVLPDGIPIVSQIGDSHAALYGQGGFVPGVIKATYGTGSSLMSPVALIEGEDFRLGRTIAWHDGKVTYALEGNITHTGAGVDWMSRMLGLENASQLAELATTVDSNQEIYFVPALSGLGAPHWQPQARGLITGLTDQATPAVLARAALESVAYQIADVFTLMEDMSGDTQDALLVDGGASQNRWLMQFQADLIQRPVIRNDVAELSALGAGYLAGRALNWWQTNHELSVLRRNVEVFEPSLPTEKMSTNYAQWKSAVERTLYNL